MKDLVRVIAEALVDDPGKVKIKESQGDHTTVFELRVAKNDLGKVIGKQGRTAQAMRIILSGAAAKENKRVVLEILDSIPLQTTDDQEKKETHSVQKIADVKTMELEIQA